MFSSPSPSLDLKIPSIDKRKDWKRARHFCHIPRNNSKNIFKISNDKEWPFKKYCEIELFFNQVQFFHFFVIFNLLTFTLFCIFSVFKQIKFCFAQFGGNFPLTGFWLNFLTHSGYWVSLSPGHELCSETRDPDEGNKIVPYLLPVGAFDRRTQTGRQLFLSWVALCPRF